jgi:hypothetical protein
MIKKDVKKLLRKYNLKWIDFAKWMAGQTVGMKDDEIDYYVEDVQRYIAMKDSKKPTYFD